MVSCSAASTAAVCVSRLIKASRPPTIQQRHLHPEVVGSIGVWGGTPVGDIKPKSHLMLIKDSEA